MRWLTRPPARPGCRFTTAAAWASAGPSTPARSASPTARAWPRRSWSASWSTTRAWASSGTPTPATTWPRRWPATAACASRWPIYDLRRPVARPGAAGPRPRDRRLPPLLLDPRRRAVPRLVHPPGAKARPDRAARRQRQPVGLVGPAGTRRRGDRKPPGLGARRRRLRRRPRRGDRAGRRRPAPRRELLSRTAFGACYL